MDDIEAIKQLKARYFRAMDTKSWDDLVQVFTPDVEVDMRGEGGDITHGVDDFVRMLRANIEQAVTVHHGHMPEIELTTPTSASGVWAMEDELWFPQGFPVSHLHGYGHYHETYRLEDGWRIASMRLSRLRRDIDFA